MEIMAESTTGLIDLKETLFQIIMFQHARLTGNKLYKLY